MKYVAVRKRVETDNRQGNVQQENGVARLVEHSATSAQPFSRRDSATFSAEDRVTLKHVAVVIVGLVAIAWTLGLISVLAM